MNNRLLNPPLVEVFLELRWELEPGSDPSIAVDPAYPFIVSRFHDRLKTIYPYREALPSTQIPDQMTPYTMKYRFRTAKDSWHSFKSALASRR